MKKLTAIFICTFVILAALVSIAILKSTDNSQTAIVTTDGGTTFNYLSDTERLVAAADNYEGTLNYKFDPLNDQVIISYDLNGDTVSYTVPNKNNYVSGGYAAVDDYNRSLNTSTEVGIYGSNGERYVGLFYFLWQGEHGDSGVYDLQKIIDTYGVEAAGKNSKYYGGVGAMHWFAEPLYGYYYASDEWVHRKHAELLANANVDFLYFDVTNGYTYLNNALSLMKELHELNEQGYDAPQVVFYTHTNSVSVVKELYNNIYKKGLYEDTWFKLDDKPVIVAEYEANINDFFTIKLDQWPNEAVRSGGNSWPWMDFEWPQRIFKDADGNKSAISVSIAQHSGNILFSSSSLYGYNGNRGRSFSAGKATAKTLKAAYEALAADPTLSYQGANFQAQWDKALKSDVKFVLVTGWNEWVAQRQPEGSDYKIKFVDTASVEYSRDAEMMRGGYFDSYYLQLMSNIEKYKGAAPVVVQDSRKAIDVSGDFAQWDSVKVSYVDAEGDVQDRNGKAFGNSTNTNTSGRNDIVETKVTSDTTYLYFYVKCANNITEADTNSSWMQIYLNADGQTTGWYGYDFIINYKAKDTNKTTVAKYSGKDGAFGFEESAEVAYRVDGKQMMIAVPMEYLGIANYNQIYVEFKVADSDTTYDEMEDFYCDGDAAPLGRLNYIYQNYIPNVTTSEAVAVVKLSEKADQIYREQHPETEAPTETATEAPTEVLTEEITTSVEVDVTTAAEEATTEAEKSGNGCGSVVAFAGILALIPIAVITFKKKEN